MIKRLPFPATTSVAIATLLIVLSFSAAVAQNTTTPMAVEPESPVQGAVAIENRPVEPARTKAVPVIVVHRGTDPLGARLAFQLKERLESSPFFRLSEEDERKLRLLVVTREEFPSRPRFGSIYSAVWIYSAGADVLNHFLDTDIGVVYAEGLEAAAEGLVSEADAVVSRYAYLFE